MGFYKNKLHVVCLNPVGFHRMSYRLFGDPKNPIFVMVHSLTGTGRDFDKLANNLADRFFVVCPDIVGRGESDWLPGEVPYNYPLFLNDLNTLMNSIFCYVRGQTGKNITEVRWLGTSMGGLLGMILASMKNTYISTLILNDIGPFVTNISLLKIKDAYTVTPIFSTREDGIKYLKNAYAGFGQLSQEEWAYSAEYMLKLRENGTYVVHYDPRIMNYEVDSKGAGINFWPYWHCIKCPVYVIRGRESQVLTKDLLDQMTTSKPDLKIHVVPGAAHAPALVDEDSIATIGRWLN